MTHQNYIFDMVCVIKNFWFYRTYHAKSMLEKGNRERGTGNSTGKSRRFDISKIEANMMLAFSKEYKIQLINQKLIFLTSAIYSHGRKNKPTREITLAKAGNQRGGDGEFSPSDQ